MPDAADLFRLIEPEHHHRGRIPPRPPSHRGPEALLDLGE